MTIAQTILKPRKLPVQARSVATIDALHIAVIQVLTREGLNRCTTTRIAERAGMSVGSLYQYYPKRDALLATILETHLDGVADAVEQACREHCGKAVSLMASALVNTFITAKLSHPDESKALYAVANERGGARLVKRVFARMLAAITAMLATASDAYFEDPVIAAAIVLNALSGPVRALLEGHVPPGFEEQLEKQLVQLLTAYLQTDQFQLKAARMHDLTIE